MGGDVTYSINCPPAHALLGEFRSTRECGSRLIFDVHGW